MKSLNLNTVSILRISTNISLNYVNKLPSELEVIFNSIMTANWVPAIYNETKSLNCPIDMKVSKNCVTLEDNSSS
jgi:hypothetical protein